MATISEQKTVETYLTMIGSTNKNTERIYRYYLVKFNNYLDGNHSTDLETLIKQMQAHKADPYHVLAEYVGFLARQNLASKTIRESVKTVRGFMEYSDIEISHTKFKHKVKLPKIVRREKKAIDRADIVNILTSTTNLRLRTYIHLIAATGMRAVEGLSIRLKDIEFDKDPAVVHIRGEFTKTKTDRHVYLTKECAEQLKQWIDYKYRERARYDKTNNTYRKYTYPKKETSLVFSMLFNRETDPDAMYHTIQKEFTEVTDRMKLTQKNPEGHRRAITIKTLRDFTKSAVADATSTDYSEWFIGHAGSTYYQKKELEHVMLFRKAEQALTFFTLLDAEEQQRKDMQIQALTEEVEKLKTYKGFTDRKIREEATKIADDLLRDRLPQIIDERMEKFLKKKNTS